MRKENSEPECPVRKAMQIFAGKWTLLIDELKFLCGKGLIRRDQCPEVPPRVEYSPTPLGEKVLPIIDAIDKFGMENLQSTD